MENNNFWNTSRGTAILKFSAWMIFFVILIIIFSFNDKKELDSKVKKEEKSQEVYEFVKYDDMQKELLKNNYSYVYNININNNEYIYGGTKCNNEDHGYKESLTGITKYFIENGIIYKDVLGNYQEINDLYTEIDSSFLDISKLFDNLKNYMFNVKKDKDARIITYDKEGYQVVITTDLKHISKITITIDNNTYDLKFTRYDVCNNIKNN